ncbi:MAG: AAA domain-containing protein, partial [Bacteroidales bacterium]|nr:AAA domain-containing protein [Bacteroidales bacterium]
MILIDGRDKTSTVTFCRRNDISGGYTVQYAKSKKYYIYADSKIRYLTDPVIHDPAECRFYRRGVLLENVSYAAQFRWGAGPKPNSRWYIEFDDARNWGTFGGGEISVVRSCLHDAPVAGTMAYLRAVAAENPLETDDGTRLLLRQFEMVDFIHPDSAAAAYLNPETCPAKKIPGRTPLIYPFGVNASQQKAVRAAFANQISVIQGPPGTGKTQTILNIVANILAQGMTVMVVSSNNSAIQNVVEKLDAAGLGFVTALLGNADNKRAFRAAQTSGKAVPEDIDSWHIEAADSPQFLADIQKQASELRQVFERQERLAKDRSELDELKVEQRHFELETAVDPAITLRRRRGSAWLMQLWNEIQYHLEYRPYRFIDQIIGTLRWYVFRLRMQSLFKGLPSELQRIDLQALIPVVQKAYYAVRRQELEAEIGRLSQALQSCDTDWMIRMLKEDSWTWLRNDLYRRYGGGRKRMVFTGFPKEFVSEFPIVLSTTFSSHGNFGSDVLFDYVVMDEASQVSSDTGVLAMMCGRNAVIVGDSMQLPNVITRGERPVLESIALNHKIHKRYDCSSLSFLESVCQVFPDAPQTLLREHYRCHPKIIGFCNRKFYGGSLVVMTRDNGEENVISAVRTAPGSHCRDRLNVREVDVVTREVIPGIEAQFADSGIGVIAPYNNQVDALAEQIGERIDVATVHKFQGREKDAIVLSTVDDIIADFSDDANLLNVAVSRARHRFCLVVSGNEQPLSRNVSDLLDYIRYNNFEVAESAVHSVFDMLYDAYGKARGEFLRGHRRISQYDSENLTYAMIEKVIASEPHYRHLGVVCHFPMRELIRDLTLIPDEEDRLYASRPGTHIDFLLYSRLGKQPVLAIETDGYTYHRRGTVQSRRDERKNRILSLYGLPLLRLSTLGSDEESRLRSALSDLIPAPSFRL